MYEIQFHGWRPGLDKVKLIKLVREDARMPLQRAMTVVDQVLNNDKVTVKLDSRQKADHLLSESVKLGAKARLISTGGMADRPVVA